MNKKSLRDDFLKNKGSYNISSEGATKSTKIKGLSSEDLALLSLKDREELEMEERRKQVDCKRQFIYIPIDRRFIGLTQKERDEIKKNDPDYYWNGKK